MAVRMATGGSGMWTTTIPCILSWRPAGGKASRGGRKQRMRYRREAGGREGALLVVARRHRSNAARYPRAHVRATDGGTTRVAPTWGPASRLRVTRPPAERAVGSTVRVGSVLTCWRGAWDRAGNRVGTTGRRPLFTSTRF